MIKVYVKGVNLDKFLRNESSIQSLKNIERKSHIEVIFDINGKNLKKFIARCDKMCYNYKILSYSGKDALIRKMRKHIGFCFGIFFATIFYILMQNLILRIDIYGNNVISNESIKTILSENNITYLKKSLNDYKRIERALKNEFDEISQISIASKGNVLIVNIKEKLVSNVERETFDIVAQCDGTIQSIEVIQGTLLKNIGDSFKKGDVIVKGEFVSMQGNIEKCRAEANITYIESHFLYTEFKEIDNVLERTGNKTEYKTIDFFGLTNEKKEVSPYEYSECEITKSQIFNNFFLPITRITKTFYETKIVEKVRNFEEESGEIISNNEKKLKEEYFESNIFNLFSTSVKTSEGYLITTTIQIINTM